MKPTPRPQVLLAPTDSVRATTDSVRAATVRERCPTPPHVPDHLHPTLQLLLEGYDYAHALGSDVWDFALAIQCLHRLGQTDSGLRWLTCQGLITHATEETSSCSAPLRVFQPEGPLQLSDRSCFVLTPAGAAAARTLTPIAPRPTTTRLDPPHPTPDTPHWDEARRQLRLGNTVIKEFKRPANNQELILAAFQEENWPPHIDDPLPPVHGIDPKQRLHDTIQRLNQHQVHSLIRFRGDGMGRGVRWEFAAPDKHQNGIGAPADNSPSNATIP